MATPRFTVIKQLGAGGNGMVQLAKDGHRGGALVAIKYIRRDWMPRENSKYLVREVLNHQHVSAYGHPFIVQFHEVFCTPTYLGMVMEYVDGTDLLTYMRSKAGKRLPEAEARFTFQQLIIAVAFCHNVVDLQHRDIKLGNILVIVEPQTSMPIIKLCDFGFSVSKHDSMPKTKIGTVIFTAPEIMMRENDDEPYDAAKADTWSCGVVLYCMLYGRHPFVTPEELASGEDLGVKIFSRVTAGTMLVDEDLAEMLSEGALALLKRMLDANPATRASLEEVMEDPWFQKALPEGSSLINEHVRTFPRAEQRQPVEVTKAVLHSALRDTRGADEDAAGSPRWST